MCDRVTAIRKYYIDLDYTRINKTDAIVKISILTHQIGHKNFETLPEKFFKIASIIKKNKFLFASFCKHIDIVITIVQYLIDIADQIKFNFYLDEDCSVNEIQQLTFLALYNICPATEVQSFLRVALVPFFEELSAPTYVKGQINEMILLQDSDLDAVVSCLKIIETRALTKIWVEEQIKEKFMFKMKYYRDLNFPIYTFRSKQELITPNTMKYNKISIVSIWSEDIVTAKNLAKSLNKTILFINTHMDFCGGVVFLPYTKIIQSVHRASEILDSCIDFEPNSSGNVIDMTCASKMISTSIYNLFYNGKWQKSTKTTYCQYNNSLWANVTQNDIQKCVNSAQKGFENWSIQSVQFRSLILTNLAYTFIFNGYVQLGSYLLEILTSFQQYGKFRTNYFKRRRLEVTEENVPLGIVILKEQEENILFHRLLKILISGNSVIIIHNANFYNFAPYCDICTTCGIPSGVINMLSHDNIESLEFYLCKLDYATYVKNVYSNNLPHYPTQSKYIILPLK